MNENEKKEIILASVEKIDSIRCIIYSCANACADLSEGNSTNVKMGVDRLWHALQGVDDYLGIVIEPLWDLCNIWDFEKGHSKFVSEEKTLESQESEVHGHDV